MVMRYLVKPRILSMESGIPLSTVTLGDGYSAVRKPHLPGLEDY